MSEQEGGTKYELELKRLIDIGFTFEAFCTSAPGRYLIDRAEREKGQLLEELVQCDPDDAKKNRELRMQISQRDLWRDWIAEAITEGQHAQEQFVDLEGR